MIFVTVSGYQFERLVRKMDEIAGSMKERVMMQTGNTRYVPKNAGHFRFTSRSRMDDCMKKARLVVSHGGEGCIMEALKLRKPLIVVPRYRRFGEHVNDHQLDLTRVLEKSGKITAVYDIGELDEALRAAGRPAKTGSAGALVEYIKGYVKVLEPGNSQGGKE